MKKEVFKIRGMHCASCAMTIEKAVLKLPGVKIAQVNFAAETLLAEFDENQVLPKDLREAANSVGYKLLIPESSIVSLLPKVLDGHSKTIDGKEFLALRVIGM